MVYNNANFNYIIIGAGASGCVIANRLSADASVKVLLIEAGGMDNQYNESVTDWKLKTTPQKSMFNREVIINQGKVTGGSSTIDTMVYERGAARMYDEWAATGAKGWGYADVLPCFHKLENPSGSNIQLTEYEHELDDVNGSSIFIKAARQAGYNASRLFKDAAGTYKLKEQRCESSAAAFLHPVIHRANLVVVTDACVKKVIVDSGTAIGVEYVADGISLTAKVINEVILCAGALASPKILMLSGIGPADDLRQLGIDVIHDLPGVGHNLQDNLQLPVVFRTDEPLPDSQLLAGTVVYAGTNNSNTPDIQISFNPGKPFPSAATLPNFGVPVCVFMVSLLRPASKGTVRLASTDHKDAPVIDPAYLEIDTDTSALHKAVEIIRNITQQPAFSPLNVCELVPGGANMESFIRSVAATAWHPAGTCKMGSDRMAVVDNELRVKGIRNLRVADASVIPVMAGSNPLATCFMIGEKAAGMLMDKYVHIAFEMNVL